MYQSSKEKLRAISAKVVAPVAALSAAGVGSAYATTAEDISSAFSLGGTNVSAAITGLILLTGVVVGVGLIISMLRK